MFLGVTRALIRPRRVPRPASRAPSQAANGATLVGSIAAREVTGVTIDRLSDRLVVLTASAVLLYDRKKRVRVWAAPRPGVVTALDAPLFTSPARALEFASHVLRLHTAAPSQRPWAPAAPQVLRKRVALRRHNELRSLQYEYRWSSYVTINIKRIILLSINIF